MFRLATGSTVLVVVVSLGCGNLYGDVIGKVIFDSFTGPNIGGYTSPDRGGTARISVSQDTTISNISVLNNMPTAGELKFAIFSHPDNVRLLVSPPQSFGPDADDNSTWKTSDDFSFTLRAGNDYHVGSIGNVGRDDVADAVSESQNGITSSLELSCVTDFASFEYDSACFPGRDAAIRLHAIPEPPSFILLGMGAVGLLAYWRQRRKTCVV